MSEEPNSPFDVLTEEERGAAKIQLSGQMARSRHEDFDNYVTPDLLAAKQEDAEFVQSIMDSDDPAEALYQSVRAEHQEANSLSNIVGEDALSRPSFSENPSSDTDSLEALLGGR